LAGCSVDGRKAGGVEHSVRELLAQRIFGLALGYEDLNDHDRLRSDPVFGVLAGKLEEPLAGKSTLNRLELFAPQGCRGTTASGPTMRRSSGCSWTCRSTCRLRHRL